MTQSDASGALRHQLATPKCRAFFRTCRPDGLTAMALRARLWAIPGQQGGEETDFGGAIRAPLFLGVGPYSEGEARAWVRARAAELRRRRAG